MNVRKRVLKADIYQSIKRSDCLKTKPNKFESGEQLISLWDDFCNEIIDNGFDKVPTQTAFCKWLADNYEETDRKTIYNSLNKIFPTIKKDFEKLQSDTIATGGMLGKYNPTMTIFALKNWCNWADKPENENEEKQEMQTELLKAIKKAVTDED